MTEIPMPIHVGIRTTGHGQSILLITFRVMNISCKALRKPIPPPAPDEPELLELITFCLLRWLPYAPLCWASL